MGMENLDLLLLADDNGIIVDNFTLQQIPSISMEDDGRCYIAVDPRRLETAADERAHLAHELGHCMTGSFYNRYSKFDIRGKHERRANVWAIKQLIPPDKLCGCVKRGLREHWEIAEEFDVPAWFAAQAMEYYHQAT